MAVPASSKNPPIVSHLPRESASDKQSSSITLGENAELNLPAPKRSTSSIVAFLVAGLACVYLVPYLVPVRDGLSFSYMVGYSNRTASLLLFAFILGFSLWTGGLGLALPKPIDPPTASFTRTGYTAIAASVAGAILLWLLSVRIVPLAESQYFLDRYEMYRMGWSLYRGFEFDYGPIMFYLPVILSKSTHLSLGNSYFLSLTLQWALGTWILWKTVEVAARNTAHGRTLFLLVWFFFLIILIGSGPNYTPLRFSPPLGLAVAVYALYRRRFPIWMTFGIAAVGATVMLFFSPEQGIVFTVSTVLFFLVCARPMRGQVYMGLGFFLLLMFGAFYLASRAGVMDNIRTVGGGALNFPILFSFQSLVVLLLVVVAGCVVITSFRERSTDSPLLYLICLSLVSAPAALSRADVGHIIINMLGAILASLIVLSQYKTLWRCSWISFAAVLGILAVGTFANFRATIREQLLIAAFSDQHHSPGIEKLVTGMIRVGRSKQAPAVLAGLRANYSNPVPSGDTYLPAETRLYAPLGVRRRVVPFDHVQVVTGRYPWLHPMTSTGMIREKIAEIEAHPDWPLILPSPGKLSCEDDPAQVRSGMKKLLQVPYMPPVRHSVRAAIPLCDYLNANYAPSSYTSPAPDSYVWLRKTGH